MDNPPISEEENKPNLPKGCLPNFHPERQRFDFDELTIDTLFDSANLSGAKKYKDFHYHLWIAPDSYLTASQSTSRTWFYFRITNVQNPGKYTFTLKNMNRQFRLYEAGMMPVVKTVPSAPNWTTIEPQTILMKSAEKDLEVTFNHTINNGDKEVYFAYTYPWSYTDDQEFLDQCEEKYRRDGDIYFHRELIAYSRDNKRIELLTISSHSHKLETKRRRIAKLVSSQP